MDWQTFAEALRYGTRPVGFFVWAFLGVLFTVLFWPYALVAVSIVAPLLLARAWKSFRFQMEAGVSRLPPLCREDWRRARSKLKKGKYELRLHSHTGGHRRLAGFQRGSHSGGSVTRVHACVGKNGQWLGPG